MRIARRALLAAPVLPGPTFAQTSFPERPIRLIVPWAPGASADAVLRHLAELAGRRLGQPVVPENRAGATGTLGAIALKEARPDGYTMSQMHPAVFRVAMMQQRPAYDSERDFTWIIQLAGSLHGIVVRADATWRSLSDLLAHARNHPGQLNYGTFGVGSVQHMTMERIAASRGLSWTHVPYRGGGGELYGALLSRQIDVVADASGWEGLVRDGQFRLLATWGTTRAPSFLDAPTLGESGIALAVDSPYGLAGPRGMDATVVRILHDAFQAALTDPSTAAVLARFSKPNLYLDSAAYAASILGQIEAEREGLRQVGMLARP